LSRGPTVRAMKIACSGWRALREGNGPLRAVPGELTSSKGGLTEKRQAHRGFALGGDRLTKMRTRVPLWGRRGTAREEGVELGLPGWRPPFRSESPKIPASP
jgi:hypothetical protein